MKIIKMMMFGTCGRKEVKVLQKSKLLMSPLMKNMKLQIIVFSER
jgi:hypothetical protein